MAHDSASRESGLFDHGTVWDEEIARGAFAGFDAPRRRITGATPNRVVASPAPAPAPPAPAPPAPAASRHARPPAQKPSAPGVGVPGRRTVTIRGYGAERNLSSSAAQSRRRPTEPVYQRPGFKADRMAMWAVLLGIVLVVVAAASAHGAVLSHSSRLAASQRGPRPVHSVQARTVKRAELRITARR